MTLYQVILLVWSIVLIHCQPKTNEYHIALIGDSLIHRAVLEYSFIDRLKLLLPNHNITFTDYGVNGYRIADIKRVVTNILLLDKRPDAFMLLWDSDVSDVNEKLLSLDEINALRLAYKQNLEYVVENILKVGAFLSFGGPVILGEGKIGKPRRFFGKLKMLEEYEEINKEIAILYDVEFMAIRQLFLDAIPSWFVMWLTY